MLRASILVSALVLASAIGTASAATQTRLPVAAQKAAKKALRANFRAFEKKGGVRLGRYEVEPSFSRSGKTATVLITTKGSFFPPNPAGRTPQFEGRFRIQRGREALSVKEMNGGWHRLFLARPIVGPNVAAK